MALAEIGLVVGMVKDVALAVAGVVTALVARKGLNNWLRELGGRTKFEAALALMRASYSLREALFNCRAPLVVAAEFPAGYKQGGINPSTNDEVNAWNHVFKHRWSHVATSLKEFDTRGLEVEAIWGTHAREATQRLSCCVSILYAAIESYVDNCVSEGENFKVDREFSKKIRSEVFGTRNSADNKLTTDILTAIQALEDFARPHLRHG
ncbi:hypothetical protein [Paraburkholderia aspalathi]|uniref:hypothetical protein n=1 Tax=Paraburkholderia aspalathi TaxID=1324617 RepID=UPI001B0D6AA4|nr:hypothetical protein [Paraburkholderia aspalathi]CAE6754484.1 hypothetical protein R20943_03073 [Paraburkholderia aspalathi]